MNLELSFEVKDLIISGEYIGEFKHPAKGMLFPTLGFTILDSKGKINATV